MLFPTAGLRDLSVYSTTSGSIIFVGYIAQSSLLQYVYYYRRKSDVKTWKIRDDNIASLGDPTWWLPLLGLKTNRPWTHQVFASLNLIIASIFALVVTELSLRGLLRMNFDTITEYGTSGIFYDLITAIVYESVVEYYWHRMMHLPWFYRNFHKYHHHYKSPEPWDDMHIHPLEACG